MFKLNLLIKSYIAIICAIVLLINLNTMQSTIIGIMFGVIYILLISRIIGEFVLPLDSKGWQKIYGFLIFISFVSIFSTILIYIYKFNTTLIGLMLTLIPIILMLITSKKKNDEILSFNFNLKSYYTNLKPTSKPILLSTYIALVLICFIFLFLGQTAESIQAPWQVVNSQFFLAYFLATALLITYLLKTKLTKLPLLLIVLHSFLSSSVALIVYKIGFGFDPFIHQATEKIIFQTGTITPTPLYYLGQYGLVVFLSKIFSVNLIFIDKLLVPVLFSVFLPLTTYFVFKNYIERNYALLLSLAALIIPFGAYIMTAPQNLANLFFIITILLSLLYLQDKIKVSILYLLAIAAVAIHPLAGIPLIFIVFFIHFAKIQKTLFSLIGSYLLFGILLIISLPLAFLVNGSTLNLSVININFSNIELFTWVDKFDLPLNLVYLLNYNIWYLSIIVILIGIIYIVKNQDLKKYISYLIAGIVIFLQFLITKYFIDFPNLREHDQLPFVNRLLILSFYILLPVFLFGLYVIIKKLNQKQKVYKIFLTFIFAGLITTSLYLSYPKINNFEPAKFFSLSQSDLNAVNLIENDSSEDYVVLANQMVGVAAIKELGFKKYYDGIFFYSMPMDKSQIIYENYLEMIYMGAKKEFMQKAMDVVGVDISYFVLNDYWRNFEKIKQQATISADQVFEIDEGKIYVFKYTR